jgi:hypothetical protein
MNQVSPMHKSEMCLIKCHYYQFNLISDPGADNQTCGRTAVMLAATTCSVGNNNLKISNFFSCTYYKKFYYQKPSIKYSLMFKITFIFKNTWHSHYFCDTALCLFWHAQHYWQFLHKSKNFLQGDLKQLFWLKFTHLFPVAVTNL